MISSGVNAIFLGGECIIKYFRLAIDEKIFKVNDRDLNFIKKKNKILNVSK